MRTCELCQRVIRADQPWALVDLEGGTNPRSRVHLACYWERRDRGLLPGPAPLPGEARITAAQAA
ncbi:MAG: hypothetical protein IRZ14_19790 [Chloroflexi bacterium]|nr:hypothetical protein [Chloroflexota bacterium]